ncbi:Protein NLRC3 [Durusdinium trenchii]|uniref:Protein NLRC3 n=1 Tax=Durusdinium trenchii TaxID=1381693 RepID=A0ABP0QQ15_9DINO
MWLHFVHHLTLHFEARTAETENDGPKKASAETENDGPKKASAFPSEPRIKVLAEWYLRRNDEVFTLGHAVVPLHPMEDLGDAGAQALAAMLCENRSVEKVYLQSEDIGELGGQALLEALRQNSRVWVMEFWRNLEVQKEIQELVEANKEALRRQKEAFFAPLKELQRLSEAQPGMGKSLLDRLEGTTWLDERKCPIAHIQSGEIFWSNTMASMASLISDGTIVVTISHGDVVARGEVDLDTEPACITWSRWNDLPSQIMSFVWIKG